jgi:hypothetical protein
VSARQYGGLPQKARRERRENSYICPGKPSPESQRILNPRPSYLVTLYKDLQVLVFNQLVDEAWGAHKLRRFAEIPMGRCHADRTQ